MHAQYGDLDGDYAVVNLSTAPVGQPMRDDAGAKLVAWLRPVSA
ncbi:hypothetical protein [Paenarthrobacter aurescens]